MKNIPFWEESYKNNEISAFGTDPNQEIAEYLDCFNKQGAVLEVGCGEAKNSFYLIENGFEKVKAFDLSENAVAKVHKIAEQKNIKITAFVQDLCNFEWKENYDLIISYGTLHFVAKKEWHKFLNKAKKHTSAGGIHVIQIFTNKVPASQDIKEFAIGLADEGELEKMYKGWKILGYRSFILEDEHPGAPKHYHAINKIVAQKI